MAWVKLVGEEEWYRDFNCNGSTTIRAPRDGDRSTDQSQTGSPAQPPEQPRPHYRLNPRQIAPRPNLKYFDQLDVWYTGVRSLQR